MTYKVSPLVMPHHPSRALKQTEAGGERDSPLLTGMASACFFNDQQLGEASLQETSPSGCFLGHIST